MKDILTRTICDATGARRATEAGRIQQLWSGYGHISRYRLEGCEIESVVVKHVRPPPQRRGAGSASLSHRRKVRSYRVETAWYRDFAAACDARCRVPACFGVHTTGDEVVMVLEDLDAAGFPRRASRLGWERIEAGLSWLANFHATFLGREPSGLWASGTYWHLQTRPDELEALGDRPLRHAAGAIDRVLRESPFQTLVHGDAKLQNFCFSRGGHDVAAVDFQYVGGGCGMKDVAYFISSCLSDEACGHYEARVLDAYFGRLKSAVQERGIAVDPGALEADWRRLYPVAWADFHRFYEGWSPGGNVRGGYSDRVTRTVIAGLKRRDGHR